MDKLIAAIQDWPVLIQGAVGSAIFWLVLVIGQRIASGISAEIRRRSRKTERAYLQNQIIRLNALKSGSNATSGAYYASVLWYRASRDLIRGLIWLTLGLMFGTLSSVFAIVGFLGCLAFLFAAHEVVKPISDDGKIDEKLAELTARLAVLKNS